MSEENHRIWVCIVQPQDTEKNKATTIRQVGTTGLLEVSVNLPLLYCCSQKNDPQRQVASLFLYYAVRRIEYDWPS